MPRIFMRCTLLALGFAAAGCPTSPESAPPEPSGYDIDFDRPVAPGDRWKETSSATTSFRESGYDNRGQTLAEESVEGEVRLQVDAEVLDVAARGRITKMRYTVRSMTATVNGAPAEAIPPDTVVEATAAPAGDTILHKGIPGHLIPGVARLAETLMGAKHPSEPSDAELMNPTGPVEPGDQWPVDTGAFRRGFEGGEISLTEARVTGHARLEDVHDVRGTECFAISSLIEATDFSIEALPGFTVTSGTLLLTMSGDLPTDPTKRWMDQQSSLHLEAEASAPNGVTISRVFSIETEVSFDYPAP